MYAVWRFLARNADLLRPGTINRTWHEQRSKLTFAVRCAGPESGTFRASSWPERGCERSFTSGALTWESLQPCPRRVAARMCENRGDAPRPHWIHWIQAKNGESEFSNSPRSIRRLASEIGNRSRFEPR